MKEEEEKSRFYSFLLVKIEYFQNIRHSLKIFIIMIILEMKAKSELYS